ncbi:hypothetical protein [Aestuariimicrobium ganziense]|uniref:hypothetical protein n=1 Tax=Aestuariimicrobium ganziense TaxID=2773677 RepID=UPI001940DFB3|nr:hypothetical protein [Aestuariimicrobium ganziense]
MARRPSKHLRPARPLNAGHATDAHKADGRWIVRSVAGDRTTKSYTCPWCHRTIGVGQAHVVAWPDTPGWQDERAVDNRRHFHTGCWGRKP